MLPLKRLLESRSDFFDEEEQKVLSGRVCLVEGHGEYTRVTWQGESERVCLKCMAPTLRLYEVLDVPEGEGLLEDLVRRFVVNGPESPTQEEAIFRQGQSSIVWHLVKYRSMAKKMKTGDVNAT